MVKSALPSPNTPLVGSDGKITSAWFQYFQNEHNRTGGNSTDLIANLQVQANDATASGLFQVVPGTASAGAEATVDFEVKAGADGEFSSASLKMSALAGGASRIELDADTVQINGTILSDGALQTTHLTPGAATGAVVTTFSAVAATADTNWHTLTTGTQGSYSGEQVQIDVGITVDCTAATDKAVSIRLLLDGTVIQTWEGASSHGMTVTHTALTAIALTWNDTPAAGTHTYSLEMRNPAVASNEYTVDGSLRVTDIKR